MELISHPSGSQEQRQGCARRDTEGTQLRKALETVDSTGRDKAIQLQTRFILQEGGRTTPDSELTRDATPRTGPGGGEAVSISVGPAVPA